MPEIAHTAQESDEDEAVEEPGLHRAVIKLWGLDLVRTRADLFSEVYDSRSSLPGNLSSELRNSLASLVQIRGFTHDPLTAGKTRILKALQDAPWPDRFGNCVWECWQALNPAIHKDIREYLRSDEGRALLARTTAQVAEPEALTAWSELAQQVQDRFGRSSAGTTLLLYFAAAVEVKALELQAPPAVPSRHETLDSWLALLEDLPPDSSLWDGLEDFFLEARQLAGRKSAEREQRGQKLHTSLQALVEEYPELVEMFEAPELAGIEVGDLCIRVVTEQEAHLDFLRRLLEDYEGANDCHSGAKTLSSKRELRAEMDRLELEIQQAFGEVQGWVRREPGEAPGPVEVPESGVPSSESVETNPAPVVAPSNGEVAAAPEAQPATSPAPRRGLRGRKPSVTAPPNAAGPLGHDPLRQAPAADEVSPSSPANPPLETETPEEESSPSPLQDAAPEADPAPSVNAEPETAFDAPPPVDPDVTSPVMSEPDVAEEVAPAEVLAQEPVPSEAENLPDPVPAQPVVVSLQDERPGDDSSTEARGLGNLVDLGTRALQRGTLDDWNALLCGLVVADDAAGAFWLARSLEARNDVPAFPCWMLKALQGARWLPRRVPGLVEEMYELTGGNAPQGDLAQELLGVASALRLALAEPASGAEGWLHLGSHGLPALSSVVRAVLDFTHRGLILAPHAVYNVQGLHHLEEQTAAAAAELARWLEDAPRKTMKAKRATDVWLKIVGGGGHLRPAVEHAARDRRERAAEVKAAAEKWSDQYFVDQQIHRLDHKLQKGKYELTADPKDQLRRETLKTTRMLMDWVRLAEAQQQHATNRDYEVQEIQKLRASLEASLSEVTRELAELAQPHQSPGLQAASCAAGRTVADLCATLSLSFQPPPCPTLQVVPESWLGSVQDGLEGSLGLRLLWMPEVPVDDRCLPEEKALEVLPKALARSLSEARTIPDALDQAVELEDFRFRHLYAAAMEETEVTAQSRKVQEALEASRERLRKEVGLVADLREQAVVDGYFEDELLSSAEGPEAAPGDGERDRLSAILLALNADQGERFLPAHRLLEAIRTQLQRQLRDALAQQREKWERLQSQVPPGSPGLDKVRVAVQDALETEDLRVVQELLDQLESQMDSGQAPKVDLGGNADRLRVLEDFRRAAPALDDWVRQHNIGGALLEFQRKKPFVGVNPALLSQPRLEEVLQGFQAWKKLKMLRPLDPEVPSSVAAILDFLGFLLKAPASSALQVVGRGVDWVQLDAKMSASDLVRPIPQFGSMAGGRYPVLCVWERPGADTLSARIKDLRLEIHNLVVLYLGRLTGRMRKDLTRVNRDRGLSVLLMDEVLLLFLAGQLENRLPAFLRCAAPHAMLNPYTPNQAGSVPPEMFFGRENLVRELQKPEGSYLVFGGRQLGKSALLRQAERQFHDPSREQFAFVEDIRVVGQEHGGDLDVLWRRLRDALVRKEFLSQHHARGTRADTIAKAIQDELQDRPHARILAMFDEADHFLDADSAQGFAMVNQLKSLMSESGNRFKVVLAGLHNVQRFQSIPNQPLAHLGRPILIGPLEPRDAFDLVEQPLSVLGFRFRDHAPVLRTLSYTNYHAGLIQLFCRELVQLLQGRLGDEPPWYVEKQDVEEVYRRLQQDIVSRFNWTLALDPRYEALTLILIAEQVQEKSGCSRAYPAGAILKMARDWWPKGFARVQTDELRGLLDEMDGLGVLVRTTQGHYRLRSPNIVRLMGTETDIEARLAELIEQDAGDRLEADEFRVQLAIKGRKMSVLSPLTRDQERLLGPPRSGVGLVFASEALGMEYVELGVQAMMPADLGEQGHFQVIPSNGAVGGEVGSWVRNQLDRNPKAERLLFLRKVDRLDPRELEEALAFCDRYDKRRMVRLVYTLTPEAVQGWLLLPEVRRVALEDRLGATWLRRYSAKTLRHRLSDADMVASEDVCRLLMEATGGWPFLVELLFSRAGRTADIRPEARTLQVELGQPELSRRFRRALGIPEDSPGWPLLETLSREGTLGREYLTPDLVDLGPGVDAQHCDHWIDFLIRMGCIDEVDDQLTLEPVVGRVL